MKKRILPLIVTILLAGATGALVGFSAHTAALDRFNDLIVQVEEIDGMYFVDEAGVRDAIYVHDSIAGSFIGDISLNEVRNWVQTIPAVGEIEVYPGLDYALHVHVAQRKPIARIHLPTGEPDQYLDENGSPLPLSPYFTARVPVIHAETLESAHSAFELVQATRQHPFWSAFIDQIVVDPTEGLELIPRIGSARIILRDMEDLEAKLANLFTFYAEQVQRGNLNAYKRIDLSFQDQVVAQRYY